MSEIIQNRYEFVLLFDVENGNPNGDPDAGNMPRIDPETGYGIVTDVCLKRKIRNYVEIVKEDGPGNKIYVKEGVPLNRQRELAYLDAGIKPDGKNLPKDEKMAKEVTAFMCRNFFDIRTFGAVMTLTVNCGQVRGAVQLNFARSIDPIVSQELTITSVTFANEGESSSKMGRKHIVPYALYRTEGYISANLAEKTGFTEGDAELLWEAILNMFEHDHAAARGKMAVRKLVVFKHESKYGNTQAQRLFDLIHAEKKDGNRPARCYGDYTVEVDWTSVPQGVELIEKI